MISKDTIKRTAICRWSKEDECFVAESPLFDRVIGTGESESEAQAIFESMLDDAYAELKDGNVIGYNKVGRPAKEGIQLNCKVKQQTHDSVSQLAKKLDISQGEVVDVIAFHYLNKPAGTFSSKDVTLAVREVLAEYGFTPAAKHGRRALAGARRRLPADAATKTSKARMRRGKAKTTR